jgi:hypothetical protein
MIKSAAIKQNDKVFVGRSHGDIMHKMITDRMFDYDKSNYIEGFVDETGKFFTRIEAAEEAFKCKQIPEKKIQLFSYDLEEK